MRLTERFAGIAAIDEDTDLLEPIDGLESVRVRWQSAAHLLA